jgi:hypothetical protein
MSPAAAAVISATMRRLSASPDEGAAVGS